MPTRKSNVSRKSKNSLIITRDILEAVNLFDKSKKIEWKGYYRYYGYFFADYLNKKYNNAMMPKNFNLAMPAGILQILKGGEKVDFRKESKIKDEFLEAIKSSNKRFVIIPVGFQKHQNIAIYDAFKNEVELFDSFGGEYIRDVVGDMLKTGLYKESYNTMNKYMDYYYNMYIGELHDFFKLIDKNVKFFKPVDFFPKNQDLQKLEVKMCPKEKFNINSWGFCVVWSYWYVELRLKNPDIPRDKLVRDVLKTFKKDIKSIEDGTIDKNTELPICKLIRGYTTFLTSLDRYKSQIEKMKLMFELHKNERIKHGLQLNLYNTVVSAFVGSLGFLSKKIFY